MYVICAFFYIKSLRDLDYSSYLAYKHIFPTGILGRLYSYAAFNTVPYSTLDGTRTRNTCLERTVTYSNLSTRALDQESIPDEWERQDSNLHSLGATDLQSA